MTIPDPASPPVSAKTPSSAGRRFLLGMSAGLLPVLLMCLFGFTQCPPQDYVCHDPNQGWGGWFFVLALALYGADILVMLGCFVFRRTRPVAWGLLPMIVLGPFLGVFGYIVVTVSRHSPY